MDEEELKWEVMKASANRLKELALCSWASVRICVAMRGICPVEVMELLAKDVDSGVRLVIVNNKKTPLSVIEKMTNDSWDKIVNKAKQRMADGK